LTVSPKRNVGNLARMARDRATLRPHGNIFALFLDGNFEASLLLLDDLWDEASAHYAPNGFVVAVPARDMLAFCDLGSEQGIRELREVLGRVFPYGDHLISRLLYRREARRWVPFSAQRDETPPQ
jgi:hypothetical protein